MTICRERVLCKHNETEARARELKCRSWNCELCVEERRRQLLAQAASGQATRFITLTVNPRTYSDPEERLRKLAWAWRTIIKTVRYDHPGEEVEYFAVVEATLAGEPHLHILFRGPYLDQDWLSNQMERLIDAPIVWIKKIDDPKAIVKYIGKYITKKPAQFGTSKRYWQSRNYQIKDEYQKPVMPLDDIKWSVEPVRLETFIMTMVSDGWAPRSDGRGGMYFRRIGASVIGSQAPP